MRLIAAIVASVALVFQATAQPSSTFTIVNGADSTIFVGYISNADTIKNGSYKYFRNGVLDQTGWFCNNQICGEWLVFYPNQKLKIRCQYNNNMRHGLYELFDANGYYIQRGTFNNNLLCDTLYQYDEFGKLHTATPYSTGKKCGTEKQYYATKGLLMCEQMFKNDQPCGLYRRYYDSGELNYVGIRDSLGYQGKFIALYQNGDTLRICHYTNGILNGDMVEYHENGNIKSKSTYINGARSGKSSSYFSNGSLAETGEYLNDRKTGKWTAFYPDGSYHSAGEFINGKLSGYWTIYYQNGQVKQRGQYINGKAQGYWSFFHDNGNLWKSGYFANDHECYAWQIRNTNGNIESAIMLNNGVSNGLGFFYDNNKRIAVMINGNNAIPIFNNTEE